MANDGDSQSLESDAMLPPYDNGTGSSDSSDNGYVPPPPPYSEQRAAASESIDGGRAAVTSMVRDDLNK
jgi:hypothetical protein